MPEKIYTDGGSTWTSEPESISDTAYHRDDIVRQLAAALVAMDVYCISDKLREKHAPAIAQARKII